MKLRFGLFLSVALFMCTSCFSQDARLHIIDSIFSDWYNSGAFSGNVLIAEKGKPLYKKSFGLADQKTQHQLDANSMFLLGSVSKQFTAFGVALLKEEGKLSYDDDMQKYLPQLPYKGITIRQLLTHTSGIPDYISLMEAHWDRSKYASNDDVIQMLVQYHPPVLFHPGTKYEYSNTGYALLASIIEKVSGMSFQKFMEEKVFKPLDMTRTIIYTRRYAPRQVADYALGYVHSDSLQQYVLPDEDAKYKLQLWEDGVVGEDGVNLTTGDLLKWDRALFHNKLISDATLKEIFTPGKVQTGETDYGFGWHIKSIPPFGTITYHSGGWPGYIAYIERDIDSDKTIIVLRNKFIPERRLPIDAIRAALYNQTTQPTVINIPDSLLNKYVGEYKLNDNFSVMITKNGGKLNAQGTGQRVLDMDALTPAKFYIKGPDVTIEFTINENGEVNKLTLHQNGQTVEGIKKR